MARVEKVQEEEEGAGDEKTVCLSEGPEKEEMKRERERERELWEKKNDGAEQCRRQTLDKEGTRER